MKLQEIQKSYQRKQRLYNTKNTNLDTQIENAGKVLEALKDAKSKLTYPHHHDNFLKPLALELEKVFKNRSYSILGPFGLNCESSIWLTKDGVEGEKRFENNNILSITFRLRHKDNEPYLVLVDHLKNTGTYNKGSIGEANGDNYPSVDLPETFEELVKFVRKQNRKKNAKI